MGVVYAARDSRLDRLVAIKVLPDLVSSDAVRERFLREARAAARLSHPSIVPIYAADDRGGVTFLVMAYVDGPTLSARLRDGSALPPETIVPLLRDVAQALGAAHARGVIHRDVKPENILVDRVSGRAMVTDFGIARLADAMQAGALTRTGQVLGTVGYMSPEQVTASEVDGRSDLYSLGVVAFEALTGRLPFDGPAPSVIVAHATTPAPPLASVAPHVPAAVCAIVDKCLRKQPSERYATGDELARAFEGALATTVAAPPKLEMPERLLTEREADRVWQRAAELQAGVGSPNGPRPPTASITAVSKGLTDGFRIEHVREAAMEAGISAPYVSLALDELLRPRGETPAPMLMRSAPVPARGQRGAPVMPVVRALHPRGSRLAGAPSSIIYEVDVQGQLSPNDFDVVAHTIRARMGEVGVATALGRSLSWTTSHNAPNSRRVHISITAAAGRTQIRVEERLDHFAGATFGGIVGGGGGGIGFGSLGITLGAMHSGLAALVTTTLVLTGAYSLARSIFTRTVHRRASELHGLSAILADQIAGLIAEGEK
jgi:hypothetical protein